MIGLVLMLFLKLNIKIEVQQINKDFDGTITIQMIARFIRYTMKIPAMDLDEETPSIVFREETEGLGPEEKQKMKLSVNDFIQMIENFNKFLINTIDFYKIVQWFLSKCELSNVQWETHLGLEDAAKTGTGCGGIWMIKGTAFGLLAQHMRLVEGPKMEVYPYFQDLLISTRFQCIVSFRIGYAIRTGLKVLRHRRKKKQ